jgi:hypothetical protein
MKKQQLLSVSLVIGLLLALSAFSVSAHDRVVKLRAKLVGAEEVPLVSTPANGEFEARIESDDTVSYKLSYEGLQGGNTLFAHIHLGQFNVNGGIMVFLCGGGTKPTACPNQAGTVEGTIKPADITGPTGTGVPAQGISPGDFAEFVRALRNGTAYVNVHTVVSPGGEIRGQVKVDRSRFGHHDDRDDHDRHDQ